LRPSPARRLGLPVHPVTVVDAAGVPAPPLDVGAASCRQLSERVLTEARIEAREVVEPAGRRLIRGGLATSWEVRSGPAAPSIMDACGVGDLPLISSRGRTGPARWLLGNVAEELVREGPTSVRLARTKAPPAAGGEPGAAAADEVAARR